MTADELSSAAHALLRRNWREGFRRRASYGFVCPGTPRYRHQWYWDSCFHAISQRHFDAGRARTELRTLVRAGDGTGLIPHTAFWDAWPRWRRAPFYATARPFGDFATRSIQTPLLALAWELVAQSSPDHPGFAAEALEELCRHYGWLGRARDIDGDSLISIMLPDESGLDDSPKYDAVYGKLAHWRPGYFRLVERCRRLGYDMRAVAERYDDHLEDVLVNVLYALSLRALSRLTGDDSWARRGAAVEQALLDRCYDERTGLFFDLAGRDERQVRVSTWSSLSPLALPALPEDVRRRIVEEHILVRSRYGAPTGVPSVSLEEPSFTAGFDYWRCWRGPSWVASAWLLVPPMRELGYGTEADRIVESLLAAIDKHGFREYYNPVTGRGLGTRGFGPATLIVDLIR